MGLVRTAAIYWAVVFAAGFVFGTVRVLWGAAALGEGLYQAIEIPFMLVLGWVVAWRLVRRGWIAGEGAALKIGALAFALLMVAEAALGLTLFGETLPHWLANLTHPPRLWGLFSQILFALTPWAVVRMGVR